MDHCTAGWTAAGVNFIQRDNKLRGNGIIRGVSHNYQGACRPRDPAFGKIGAQEMPVKIYPDCAVALFLH
jgi:hypothetical protein